MVLPPTPCGPPSPPAPWGGRWRHTQKVIFITATSSSLDLARAWHRAGYSVLPVIDGEPAIGSDWRREAITANEKQLITWWAKMPSASVGVVTGNWVQLTVSITKATTRWDKEKEQEVAVPATHDYSLHDLYATAGPDGVVTLCDGPGPDEDTGCLAVVPARIDKHQALYGDGAWVIVESEPPARSELPDMATSLVAWACNGEPPAIPDAWDRPLELWEPWLAEKVSQAKAHGIYGNNLDSFITNMLSDYACIFADLIEQAGEVEAVKQRALNPVVVPDVFSDLSDINDLPPLYFLIEGVWPAGSYGVIGGSEKSFKSFFASYVALCVASGKALFGEYPIGRTGPVVIFTGETDVNFAKRRLLRLAKGMGITAQELEKLPIRITGEQAKVGSAEFTQLLYRELSRKPAPVLVIIDPWYVYHQPGSEGQSIYVEGPMLQSVSSVVSAAGSALMIVHHFTKQASGLDLANLTQAGFREWADSWLLMEAKPNFEAGLVKVKMRSGTRQADIEHNWSVELHLDKQVGPVEYVGELTWRLADGAEDVAREAILNIIRDHPREMTKTEILAGVPGRKTNSEQAWAQLSDDGIIRSVPVERSNARGQSRKADVWELV